MFFLFSKYWRLILDAVLLVALIVIIFLWNPFNIFGKNLRLHATANHVTSIREIGQLVTAEYYGEVLATLDDATVSLIRDQETVLNDSAESIIEDLKSAMIEIYNINQLRRKDREIPEDYNGANDKKIFKQKVRNSNILLKVNYHWKDEEDTKYNAFELKVFEYLRVHEFGESKKLKEDKLKMKFVQQTFMRLYEDAANAYRRDPEDFDGYASQPLKTQISFTDFIAGLELDELDKKELAMIGRGW